MEQTFLKQQKELEELRMCDIIIIITIFNSICIENLKRKSSVSLLLEWEKTCGQTI
jgi:hypothetical protein